MFKGIVFDLDGTLVNTLDDLKNAINNALKTLNYPFSYSLEETKKLIGSGTKNLCRRAIASLSLGEEKVEELFCEFTKQYNEHQLDNARLYDGVLDTLRLLKEKNIKVAVLSNKVHHNTKEILSCLCKNFDFDYVLGQVSYFPLKPDPTSLNYIISKLGLNKEEILYVGDSDTDMKTGRNAKVKICAVTYGFREKEELETYSPDYMIDNFSELIYIVVNR